MIEHKNTILAIVLSLLVVVGWQYFIGYPQMQKQREEARLKQQEQTQVQPGATQPSAAQPATPAPQAGAPAVPGAPPAVAQQPATLSREAVIAASPHVAIDTPRLRGSIDLKGARIDNLSLEQYRETVDPHSPPIVLFSPSGAGRLLCGIRLGAGIRHDREGAGAGYGMEARRQRRVRRRASGCAQLRQR